MRGDFTRNTFDKIKHYNKVRQQQGRVQLDADFNEQVDILSFIRQLTNQDVIGFAGGPEGTAPDGSPLAGFFLDDTGGTITIRKGRYYVGGLLVQNEEDVPLFDQPDLRNATLEDLLIDPDAATDSGLYVAFLDVWERHITALQDPDIREVALGGPDTATRVKTVWQVKLAPIDDPSCDIDQPVSNARLAARATPDPETTDPCELPPGAGYRGLENQLYRVEIHDGGVPGTATFKWSRENGAVVSVWQGTDGNNIEVSSIGKDEALSFISDSWVELTDDNRELRGAPGIMAEVATAEGGVIAIEAGTETESPLPNPAGAEFHPIARRWEGFATVEIPAANDGWIELEDGVEVKFDPAATYETGDYWLIPARTTTGQVEWEPAESYQPREGVQHYYAPVAVIETDGEAFRRVRDCRDLFPPLTDLDNDCCITVRPGEDIQTAIEMVAAAGGGCVSLCAGVHQVNAPLVIRDAVNITLHGDNLSSVLELNGGGNVPGVLVENARGIAFEKLFMVGRGVDSIISVDPTDDYLVSEDIAVRDALLVNVPSLNQGSGDSIGLNERVREFREAGGATYTEEVMAEYEAYYTRARTHRVVGNFAAVDGLEIAQQLTCAIRLAHTRAIEIDNTRMFADVGIISKFGSVLPTIDTGGQGDNGDMVSRTMSFSSVDEGVYTGDETIEENGITGNVMAAPDAPVSVPPSVQVRTFPSNTTGGSGRYAETLGSLLVFSADVSISRVTLRVARDVKDERAQSPLYLMINGELLTVNGFNELNGTTHNGVSISATTTLDPNVGRSGTLTLNGALNDFGIGGSGITLDDVTINPDAAGIPSINEADYGEGVWDVKITRTGIRYNRFGILSLKSVRWLVDSCDIQPYSPAVLKQVFRDENQARLSLVTADEDEYRALQHVVDALFAIDVAHATKTPKRLAKGTAIHAFLWQDCIVRDSRIAGGEGIAATIWLRGDALNNVIHTGVTGLRGTWLHAARWEGNRIRTPGTGMLIGGGFRMRIKQNKVRARVGFGVADTSLVARDLVGTVRLMAAIYPIDTTNPNIAAAILLWVLLEECADIAGLRPVIEAADEYLSTLDIAVFSELPFLLVVAAALGTQLMRAGLDENTNRTTLPVIDLDIHHNDIEAAQYAIAMTNGLPFGGLKVSHNRLHTRTGQALLFDANVTASNPHATNFVLRYLMRQLVEDTIPNLIENVDGDDEQDDALRALYESILTLTTQWRGDLQGLYESDYRIESNTIHSLYTAVETNVADMAVLNNHITLHEQPIPTDEVIGVMEAMEAVAVLAPMAYAYSAGSGSGMETAAEAMENENVYANANNRREIGDAAATINNRSSNEYVRVAAGNVVNAASGNDTATLSAAVNEFVDALRSYTDSQGILLRGIGCRAIGNHIVVPADEIANTSARGGIQIAVDSSGFALLVVLRLLLQNADLPDDALFHFTETLIESNEITNGFGAGIDMQGTSDASTGLFDLKIRNNQVRGMGAAGIHINEFALAIGLDIENNHISGCGLRAMMREGVDRGGIIVKSAALVRVQDNRISNCGAANLFGVYGIYMDTIYGLSLEGNHILLNGSAQSAGVLLEDVVGEVHIADNQFAFNHGYGLYWQNLTANRGISGTSWALILNGLTLYMSRSISPTGGDNTGTVGESFASSVLQTQGLVANNQFRVTGTNLPAFEIRGVDQLTFNSNTGRNQQLEFLPTFGILANISLAMVIANNIVTDAQSAMYCENIGSLTMRDNLSNKLFARRNSPLTSANNVPNLISV